MVLRIARQCPIPSMILYRGKTQGLMTAQKHKALAWQATPSFWQGQISDTAEMYAVCKADALWVLVRACKLVCCLQTLDLYMGQYSFE